MAKVNYKNYVMETNIKSVSRPKDTNERQEKLYKILDYVNTLEEHISYGNEMWLEKFMREYREKLLDTNVSELLKELE